MMFGVAGLADVLAAPPLAADLGRGDPDGDRADRVGPLAEGVDVVGEQPRMAGQDVGQRLVDRPEERVDRAVALGRRAPLVIARGDDDGAAAARVAARRGRPADELERVGGQARSSTSSPWGRGRTAGGRRGDRAIGAAAVVKWRSSRRRSSEPDFQIAYSSESASAEADAAMMLVSLPIVDQVRVAVHRIDDDPGPRRGRRARRRGCAPCSRRGGPRRARDRRRRAPCAARRRAR